MRKLSLFFRRERLPSADSVAFIRKATSIDFEFAKALEGTFSEWLSENDEEAYRDLFPFP